jgi:TPR repeat protein
VEWYAKAAEQGYARAQCNLGSCYYNGTGINKDPIKAVEWYIKAAKQGYASAQYNLGICDEHGKGVGKDLTKAVEWYAKAAEQDNAMALYNLGVCYENGYGVEKNLRKALELYEKANIHGCEEGIKRINTTLLSKSKAQIHKKHNPKFNIEVRKNRRSYTSALIEMPE